MLEARLFHDRNIKVFEDTRRMQGAGFNKTIEIEMMIAPMLLVGEHVLELRVSDAMLHDAKEMHATLASRRDNTVQLLVSAR